jgi:hypothetical protein
VPLHAVAEALLYPLRTASPWRLLPRDFPNRLTVQRYLYALAGRWAVNTSISCCCNKPANGPVARQARRPG